jgi:hypothetical protein
LTMSGSLRKIYMYFFIIFLFNNFNGILERKIKKCLF